MQSTTRLSNEVDKTREEIVALHSHVETIVAAHAADPDRENRLLAARLREEIERNKGELRSSTAHLIAPDDMAHVLETVLQKFAGLTFVRFEGLGVESVFDGALKLVDGSGQTTAPWSWIFPPPTSTVCVSSSRAVIWIPCDTCASSNLSRGLSCGAVSAIKVEEYPNSAAYGDSVHAQPRQGLDRGVNANEISDSR